jgi:spermidine synthase
MNYLYYLYATTIFLSSFLLFQVQPLMGKHILPWFGGSSAVWITALFFFMIALALGYLYAQLLSWFSRTLQLIIHGSILCAVAGSLVTHAALWPSAITPLVTDMVWLSDAPVAQVFLVLSLSIGLPFVLLSSSSSLLQYWYGRVSGQEPFSLYAVSNVGSLLGLLSYPLIFERLLPTITQGFWWSWGVGAYIACVVVVMGHYAWATKSRKQVAATDISAITAPSYTMFLKWTALASVPVATMVAGTSFITGYVAAIPFLWILPLSLYLISFMVTFRTSRRLPMEFNFIIVLLASFVSLVVLVTVGVPVPLVVFVLCLSMFAVYHLCHEALYAARPDSSYLTRFYVALSLGGIVASAGILVSTLYVLKIPIEFLLILLVAGIYSCYWLLRYGGDFFIGTPTFLRPSIAFAAVVLVSTTSIQVYFETQHALGLERNFFGYKAVMERSYEEGVSIRTLVHGTTNHGYQFTSGPHQLEPVAYYSDTSGIALAFQYLRSREQTDGLSVAVAGLGAGALSAHCEQDDSFTFFEIDPQVITLAAQYFTYLADCPGAAVVLGDARLKFAEAVAGGQYDFIILDAYADDMMPIHLMTAEALSVYLDRLAPGGILAIHISSRYLDLLPVVKGLGEYHGLFARHLTDEEPASYATPSVWTLLAREDVFTDPVFARMQTFTDMKSVLWTDTYSTIFPLLRWW